MKKSIPTILALLFTAALFFLLLRPETKPESGQAPITRVWLVDIESDSAAFLKKSAAAFEKQTGKRVYLRSATQEEAGQAIRGAENIVPPDLIVGLPEGENILCQGYALIFRDDSAPVFTPAPTSLLFSPPTPTPGPSPTPAPTRKLSSYEKILCPDALFPRFPGSIFTQQPLQDFSAGKGDAALLTANQASSLSVGWQGQALPEGKGILFLRGQALSERGTHFLSFLQSTDRQNSLRSWQLYSPFFPLYIHENSLRSAIDQSIPR